LTSQRVRPNSDPKSLHSALGQAALEVQMMDRLDSLCKVFHGKVIFYIIYMSYEIPSNFINFIDKNQRILSLGFLETLDHFSWHGANISSSVAFNLGNIGHATNTKSEVLKF
jgi:hypothetical protein